MEAAAAAPLVPGRWAVERACQFRREWRLHAWIREQNERSGQAPCGPHIWAAWRALTAGAPNVSEGLRGAPLGLDRRGKQWVRRLARRWRLLRVRPRPGAGLSLDALRAKDRRRPRAVAECRKIAPRVRLPGPKKGPEDGPTFCGRLISWAAIRAQFPGRFSGPENTSRRDFSKAAGTLQWDRFLASACPAGSSVLRINMDESSFRLWPGVRPGAVARPRQEGRALSRHLEQRVSKGAQRGAVSFVAFVCDDPTVQPLLPQFVVGNRHLLPAPGPNAGVRSWRVGCLQVLREDSAWLTAPLLVRILGQVGRALQPVAATRHVLFSMDACPVHLSPRVLQALGRLRMHFVPIASHMTPWLQPCDVEVFRRLKARQRAEYEREQLLTGTTELPPHTALAVIEVATRAVIVEGDWCRAFRLCGLGPALPTSRRFLRALGPEGCPPVPAVAPTLAQVAVLMPRRRDVAVGDLFAAALRRTEPRAGPLAGVPRRIEGEPCAAGVRPPAALSDTHPAPVAASASSSQGIPPPVAPAARSALASGAIRGVARGTRLGPWPAWGAPRPPSRS